MAAIPCPKTYAFVIKRGERSRVQSTAGRWYIDYVGGAGANILGHAHPDVVAVAQSQVAQGMHYFGTLSEAAITYAQKLVELDPLRGAGHPYDHRIGSNLLRHAHRPSGDGPQQDPEV